VLLLMLLAAAADGRMYAFFSLHSAKGRRVAAYFLLKKFAMAAFGNLVLLVHNISGSDREDDR